MAAIVFLILALLSSCGSPEVPKVVEKKHIAKKQDLNFTLNYVSTTSSTHYDPTRVDVTIGDTLITLAFENKDKIHLKIISKVSEEEVLKFKHVNYLVRYQDSYTPYLPSTQIEYTVSTIMKRDSATSVWEPQTLMISLYDNVIKNTAYNYIKDIQIHKGHKQSLPMGRYHTVEPGDTWETLSNEYNIPVSQLKYYNPGKETPSGRLKIIF